ncbi:MAG TPA: tRNA (guanosine(37)-N1)-methyltransferase TrmD [Clostridiales bacterium]|nr:tRNA (guanosine(37)-N1)-methyltransferase TrmD [Clostridiales bacterium]
MRFDIMTLFPAMLEGIFSESILKRAQQGGLVEYHCHNIREYSHNKHRKVDDTPFGGGMGMLMTVQPIVDCFAAITSDAPQKPHTVYMSPQGALLTQKKALALSRLDQLVILCGHYEGVDHRALDSIVDEEISIGDYVLTGGELPAAVLVDCITRLVDGVLADKECYENESHSAGLLEYPQYTKPARFRGMNVPSVLLSGHHANIEAWRKTKAIEKTRAVRPDMLVGQQEEELEKTFKKGIVFDD